MGRCCAVHGCLSGRKASGNVGKVGLFKVPKVSNLKIILKISVVNKYFIYKFALY